MPPRHYDGVPRGDGAAPGQAGGQTRPRHPVVSSPGVGSCIMTMHSGAMPLLSIFCQKIFDNSFSFQATEIVLTSKWGRIEPDLRIELIILWLLVGR